MMIMSPEATSRVLHRLALVSLGACLLLGQGEVRAQQAEQPVGRVAEAPPVTAEQLRQTMEEIKRRVAQQQGGLESSAQGPIAAELKSANLRIAELNETLAKVRSEREAMRTELGVTRERLVTLDAEIVRFQERMRQLEQQMADEASAQRSELAKAREEAEGTGQMLVELGNQRAELERRLTETRSELERTAAERVKQVEQIDSFANREAEIASRLSKAEAERATLDETRKSLEVAIQKLQGEAEGTRRQVAQLEQELGKSRETARSTDARNQEEAAKLNAALVAEGEAKAKLEAELEAMRSVATASVGDVKLLGDQLLKAISENLELQQLLDQMRESRELVAAELGAVKLEAEAAAKEAASLRQQLGLNNAPAPVLAATSAARTVAPPPAKPTAPVAPAQQAPIVAVVPQPQIGSAPASTSADAPKSSDTPSRSSPPAAVVRLVAEPEGQRAEQRVAAVERPQTDARSWSIRLAELKGVETNDGGVMTVVDGAVFRFGGNELADTAEPVLARVAALIETVSPSKIAVVGHTDANGQSESNRRLSLRRAESVRDWLVAKRGVRGDQVLVEGRGEEQPIASNDTPEGRRSNRRVEIYLER